MMKPTVAAGLLGVPAREIASVASSPAGDVITTTDGQAYIDVPASTPDAEGKTGLMLLAAPSEASLVVGDPDRGIHTTWNGFPVFASDALVDDTAGPDNAGGGSPVDELDGLTLDELKAIADPLGVKPTGRSNQDKHDSLVAGIRAKRAELAVEKGAAHVDAYQALVAELDELTPEELVDRAEHLGVDLVENRDDLIASIAATLLAAEAGA